MKLKTVFKEEINAGDKLMYTYKSQGITHICFGEVLGIEYKEVKYMNGKQPILHLHKTYEIIDGRRRQDCDVKVRLTNPLAFKCGQELPYPPTSNE